MDGLDSTKCLDSHPHSDAPAVDTGEISIKSSDGVIFRIQRKNLEAYAGSFPLPPPDEPTATIICLPEPSKVLEVVFVFLFPKRYPTLEDKDSTLLISIASAVEKYQVYAAMNPCFVRLRHFVKSGVRPAAILAHAIKYQCPELIDEAAQQLLLSPFASTAGRLPSYAVLPFFKYREAARNAIFEYAKQNLGKLTVNTGLKLRCSIDKERIRSDCRNACLSWIAYLESISGQAAFETEMEEHTQFFNSEYCDTKVEGFCVWLYPVKIVMSGLKRTPSIALTKFLGALLEKSRKS